MGGDGMHKTTRERIGELEDYLWRHGLKVGEMREVQEMLLEIERTTVELPLDAEGEPVGLGHGARRPRPGRPARRLGAVEMTAQGTGAADARSTGACGEAVSLRPCPFCGGTAEAVRDADGDWRLDVDHAGSCLLSWSDTALWRETPGEVALAWNAPSPAPDATAVDALSEWLASRGYDGLCNPGAGCGCGLGDLCPCDVAGNLHSCLPAYETESDEEPGWPAWAPAGDGRDPR